MASQGNANFEIPAEMRAFAEKSMEQARQAFDSFCAATQQAVSSADKQAAGAKDVRELALRFAERNIASSFEFAQRLVRARDFHEVMALHTDYVKAQVAAFGDQARELTKQTAKMAGESAPR
jgi:phasin